MFQVLYNLEVRSKTALPYLMKLFIELGTLYITDVIKITRTSLMLCCLIMELCIVSHHEVKWLPLVLLIDQTETNKNHNRNFLDKNRTRTGNDRTITTSVS